MPKLYEINQKPQDYLDAVDAFVENPKGYFVIAGKNGNGKTFTARAIYTHFWDAHSDNKYYSQVDLNLQWQKDVNEWGQATYLLQQLVQAPLLVLDDIGTRQPSPAFMDFLYAIADKRYDFKDKCGTIITTNLNSQAMREQFGDAFTSRVSSGICIRHDGADRRSLEF